MLVFIVSKGCWSGRPMTPRSIPIKEDFRRIDDFDKGDYVGGPYDGAMLVILYFLSYFFKVFYYLSHSIIIMNLLFIL